MIFEVIKKKNALLKPMLFIPCKIFRKRFSESELIPLSFTSSRKTLIIVKNKGYQKSGYQYLEDSSKGKRAVL